jgi:magnesium-transporting ATPase (P-type)
VYHCALLYFLVIGAYGSEVPAANGQTVGVWVIGSAVFCNLVLTVTFKAAVITKHWVFFSHISYWGSIAFFVIFCLIYMNMWKTTKGDMSRKVYGVDTQLFGSLLFWLTSILIPVVTLGLDYTMVAFQANFYPTADDIIRRQEKAGGHVLAPSSHQLVEDRVGDGAEHMGFAFSQSEPQHRAEGSMVPTQAQLVRRYDTEKAKPDGE